VSGRPKTQAEVLQHGTEYLYGGEGGTHDAVRQRGRLWQTCRIYKAWVRFQLHDGERGGIPRQDTRTKQHNIYMYLQQLEYNKHGSTAGEDIGTS